MRLDKFLWCVRLYKTRILAADACKRGQVTVNDLSAKPAKEVSQGQRIGVRCTPIWRQYQILGFPASRVGAKLVANYILEVTPPEETAKLKDIQMSKIQREPGMGRPTKKDRRTWERFQDQSHVAFWEAPKDDDNDSVDDRDDEDSDDFVDDQDDENSDDFDDDRDDEDSNNFDDDQDDDKDSDDSSKRSKRRR